MTIIGFDNKGTNFCFCNSFFQLLFNIDEIKKYFNRYINRNDVLLDNLKIMFDYAYGNDITSIMFKKAREEIFKLLFNSSDIIDNISENEDNNFNVIQQDVHEFKLYFELYLNSNKNDFSLLYDKLFKYKQVNFLFVDDETLCKDRILYTIEDQSNLFFRKTENKIIENNLFDFNSVKAECSNPKNTNNYKNKFEFNIINSDYIICLINLFDNLEGINILKYINFTIEESFKYNNIKYKIKGIIDRIDNGAGGGHFVYYNYDNNIWTEYDDDTINNNYIYNLNITDNGTNKFPYVIIYKKDSYIDISDDNDYDKKYKLNEYLINYFKNKQGNGEIQKGLELESIIKTNYLEIKNLYDFIDIDSEIKKIDEEERHLIAQQTNFIFDDMRESDREIIESNINKIKLNMDIKRKELQTKVFKEVTKSDNLIIKLKEEVNNHFTKLNDLLFLFDQNSGLLK